MSFKSCAICLNGECNCSSNENSLNLSSSYSEFSEGISIDSLSINSIGIDKLYVCNKCEATFKNKQTLNLHKKTVKCTETTKNETDNKKTCEYCSKKFASKQMKLYHIGNCLEKIKSDLKKDFETEILCLKEKHENEIKKIKEYYENKDLSM
jgi:hypothetical protein